MQGKNMSGIYDNYRIIIYDLFVFVSRTRWLIVLCYNSLINSDGDLPYCFWNEVEK